MLPRELEATDREAWQYRRHHSKGWAVRKFSEIWPNDDKRIILIQVDVDLAPIETVDLLTGLPVFESAAAASWVGAGVPPPNFVVVRKATLHAHLVWLLDDPIWVGKQKTAPRFARALQRALGVAVGAKDLGSLQNGVHNPWSDANQIRIVHDRAYRLRELAEHLDVPRPWSPKPDANDEYAEDPVAIISGMRNETIFRTLLHRAYRIMRHCKDECSYEAALYAEAERLHRLCEAPLDPDEIPDMLTRIPRYAPFRRRDRAAEVKAKRHAVGRTREAYLAGPTERRERAGRLRQAGKTVAQIAAELGVDERTIRRYLCDIRIDSTRIGPIPIREEPRGWAPTELASTVVAIVPMDPEGDAGTVRITDFGQARPHADVSSPSCEGAGPHDGVPRRRRPMPRGNRMRLAHRLAEWPVANELEPVAPRHPEGRAEGRQPGTREEPDVTTEHEHTEGLIH
ncbi:MAG: replication initiation protein [Candidatus Velthaea sp.]